MDSFDKMFWMWWATMVLLCGASLAGAIGWAEVERLQKVPIVATRPGLIGFGCEGFDAPAMAYEEDQFPVCQEIVRVSTSRLAL